MVSFRCSRKAELEWLAADQGVGLTELMNRIVDEYLDARDLPGSRY